MKVYKSGIQYIITFSSDINTHIAITHNYIEYIKRAFPRIILERDYKEIPFNSLDSKLQKDLREYLEFSLKKATKKVNIFTEGINHVSI